MKKAYTKPEIAMESFQLDAAIAASCSSTGYLPLNHYEDGCQAAGYFSQLSCDASVDPNDYDGNDGLCYHGPAGITFIYS